MSLKALLSNGKSLHGIVVTIKDPGVSQTLSECCDWLWIDMEHAPFSLSDVEALANAVRARCKTIVRVPTGSEEWIKRVLDLGVDGLIVPHVSTVEQARQLVLWSFYPPQGQRSIGCVRASSFGMNPHYKQTANDNRVLFVQVEDRRGVQNIDEIAQVPGVDGIIVGPYDLSGSFGKLGQVEDAEVVEAIGRVLAACQRHRKPIGIYAKDANKAREYLEQGFQLVATGIDIQYLWMSAKASVGLLKQQ